jgi:hypothetical protein
MLGFKIARAQAKKEREEMSEMFFATLAGIQDELSAVRSEVERAHAIDRAIATEREPWQLLH